MNPQHWCEHCFIIKMKNTEDCIWQAILRLNNSNKESQTSSNHSQRKGNWSIKKDKEKSFSWESKEFIFLWWEDFSARWSPNHLSGTFWRCSGPYSPALTSSFPSHSWELLSTSLSHSPTPCCSAWNNRVGLKCSGGSACRSKGNSTSNHATFF